MSQKNEYWERKKSREPGKPCCGGRAYITKGISEAGEYFRLGETREEKKGGAGGGCHANPPGTN